jgi:hypothetical protein
MGTVVDVRPSRANDPSSQFSSPFQKEMRLLPSGLDKGFAESVLGNG